MSALRPHVLLLGVVLSSACTGVVGDGSQDFRNDYGWPDAAPYNGNQDHTDDLDDVGILCDLIPQARCDNGQACDVSSIGDHVYSTACRSVVPPPGTQLGSCNVPEDCAKGY